MKTESQGRYEKYLETPYWKEVSGMVKTRDEYRCRVCNSQLDLVVHHRTYEHRGNEKEHLNDLTTLCRRCHDVFHGKVAGQQQVKVIARVIEKHIHVAPPPPKEEETAIVTPTNYKFIKYNKETWHWMNRKGLKPDQRGWAKRAIGVRMPARFILPP